MRHGTLLILALAATACSRHREPAAAPAPVPTTSPPADSAAPGAAADAGALLLAPRRLMVPVDGVRPADVPDSYRAARGTRAHNAVDILAPRGTAVLSADDGRVYRLRSNRAGGLTVYAVDTEERFVYYYAHLDRYREGLAEGAALAKGDVLGYVGSTGNARPTEPHLHFQVMRMGPGGEWWSGQPLDPRPYLVLEGRRR